MFTPRCLQVGADQAQQAAGDAELPHRRRPEPALPRAQLFGKPEEGRQRGEATTVEQNSEAQVAKDDT